MPYQPALALLAVALAFMVGVVVAGYLYERQTTLRYRAERDADRAELVRVKEQRDTLGDRLTETRKVNARLTKQVEELTRRLENVERVGRSRLYQESMEDQQARIHQATTLLKNARRDVDDAFRALDIGNKGDA